MEAPEPDEDLEATPGEGFIFVLEKATLETAKVGKGYQILNCDDHANFLRRHGKDPANYRPDIVHQELLAILDSPLNKAGRVKAVFVHTQKNVLIRISPHTRIPRTFKRFCGLMVQLLQKLSIRASNGPEKLFKVVKGPVTKYFPAGAAPALRELRLAGNDALTAVTDAMLKGLAMMRPDVKVVK